VTSQTTSLTAAQRFWRNRWFARIRHSLTSLRRPSAFLTRMHAAAIRLSGGRIRRSFLFTGGMPVLVLTTVVEEVIEAKTGQVLVADAPAPGVGWP
jgi:F420H(2)-dependent quinone reductase